MMLLLLGYNNKPSLLVEVSSKYDPTNFKFFVINGNWGGRFYNGYITIDYPSAPWTSLDKLEILCDNQEKLDKFDYNRVFIEWSKNE